MSTNEREILCTHDKWMLILYMSLECHCHQKIQSENQELSSCFMSWCTTRLLLIEHGSFLYIHHDTSWMWNTTQETVICTCARFTNRNIVVRIVTFFIRTCFLVAITKTFWLNKTITISLKIIIKSKAHAYFHSKYIKQTNHLPNN